MPKVPLPATTDRNPDQLSERLELRQYRAGLQRASPDGDWGARHLAPEKPPADLEGATIEIKTRGGETLIRSVVEVRHRDAGSVLVRDSGKG